MSEHVQVPCPHCEGIVRVPAQRMNHRPRCPKCHQPLFEGHPVEADAKSFDRHVQRGELPVVVDFWAPWCGPCRVMAPAFEAAAQRLEPGVRFLKVNTDQLPELANRFGIRGIPTVVVMKQGREVARQSGAMTQDQLKQWLTKSLA